MPPRAEDFNSQLTPDAADFLQSVAAENQQKELQQQRIANLDGLLAHCRSWFDQAKSWRSSTYETDWAMWRRHADGVYDPKLAAKKADWQSKAFVDLTPSHRENIHASLYRLMFGSGNPLEVKARVGGDQDQAQNIKDLILREMEKSDLERVYDSAAEDSSTYGSGFLRYWHETKTEDRAIRKQVIDVDQNNQPFVAGVVTEVTPVVTYRGVRVRHIPIYDVFPDPKSLEIDDGPIAYRYMLTYQDILKGIEAGVYLPENAEIYATMESDETDSIEEQRQEQDRTEADVNPTRTQYGRTWRFVEKFAMLPKKWVYVQGEEIDDPEKLVPARVIFSDHSILAVEQNQDYEGKAPLARLDYFHVNGRFFGRGIPEMLKHPQLIINEIVNQRLDEGNLVLNQDMAVVEKALVDPKDLTHGGPGKHIRIDQKAIGPNGDVRQVISPIERGDIRSKAGFNEVYEWERIAQERTSANRATLGTHGQVRDANATLGGQQLLKQAASEKFAYIAATQEHSFWKRIFYEYYKLIYQNIEPEDILNALGQERLANFQLQTPEQVAMSYRFEPQGIFESESKFAIQLGVQNLTAMWGNFPWFDEHGAFALHTRALGVDTDAVKLTPEETYEKVLAQGMAQQMNMPPSPAETPLKAQQEQAEQKEKK